MPFVCFTLCDDLLMFSLVGSDNITSILTLSFYFLLSYPLYFHSLQEELDKAFPDPTGDLDLTILNNLALLNAVINETLRLGSPFFLPRVVPSTGVTISGRVIPPGTIVALAAYSQQISVENFSPDPLVSRRPLTHGSKES